jgi:hypothetical protein
MDNLIDEQYFWGNLTIPNLTQKRRGEAQMQTQFGINDEIYKYIKRYQKQYLEMMLGSTLSSTITESKAKALFVDSALVLSPIANYVFFYWMRDNATLNTPTGEKKMNAQNAINISSSGRITRAWNDMVAMNGAVQYAMSIDETIDYDTTINEIDTESDLFNTINEYGI